MKRYLYLICFVFFGSNNLLIAMRSQSVTPKQPQIEITFSLLERIQLDHMLTLSEREKSQPVEKVYSASEWLCESSLHWKHHQGILDPLK